jgi:hypothetical protein
MKESFQVNLSNSGTVVLEKKIINDPTQFLHVDLPFEKDYAFYLDIIKFPLSKDVLYKLSLIEIGPLVLEKI